MNVLLGLICFTLMLIGAVYIFVDLLINLRDLWRIVLECISDKLEARRLRK